MAKFSQKYDEHIIKLATNQKVKQLYWLYLIFSVLFTLAGVDSILDGEVVFGAIYIAIFGVGFFPLCFGITKLVLKLITKTEYILCPETTQDFEFDCDGVKQTTIKPNDFNEVTKCTYKCIYRAYETKDCFCLYISRVKTLIVDKAGLVDGTIEEVVGYLSKSMGTKFKKYGK